MEQVNDLATILSVAGTSAFVLLVTQYFKPYFKHTLNVRLFVLILSLVIQIGLTIVLVGADIQQLILAVVNSFISATSAMGAYEATFAKNEDKDN